MTQQSHSQAYTWEKMIMQKDTCISMLIAALFTIDRTWKQPKCPSTEDQIYIDGTCIQWSISHKKEQSNAIYSSMDGPRDCRNE